MATTFEIKQGDTRPTVRAKLLDAKKKAIPLSGASVRWLMKPRPGLDGPTVIGHVTVVDVATALVEYVWLNGDTDMPGFYDAEFEITFMDGSVETVPNDGYLTVVIKAALDADVVAVERMLSDTGATVSDVA